MPTTPKKSARTVRIRMYRHGLGDCFLVRLPRDKAGTYNILIDCGLIAVAADPKPAMAKVVADIRKECDDHIDLVIMTHEHWDHASGFSTQQVQAEFDAIDIDEVWYAWTEDPESKLGKKLRRERAAKVRALHAAALALRSQNDPLAIKRAERVMSLLQFFGVADARDLGPLAAAPGGGTIEKTRPAFEYLGKRRGVKTRYCYPEKPPITLPGVSGVRVFVLGPPQDEALIKRSAPTKRGKEVYELASESAAVDNLSMAFDRLGGSAKDAGGPDCPFDASVSVFASPRAGSPSPKLAALMTSTWDEPNEAWRKIDLDWTAAAETLALNLDTHTNNTCLVVAFELTETGRVLLFAADAQVGNWLSWQDTHWRVKEEGETTTVKGPDLLERTVFYKVGHHGSHNATLRALGLEQMSSDDLVAFVPVFKEQAEKNRWHEMPFSPLVKRLREKTGGRLVFSDEKLKAPSQADLDGLSAKQKKAFIAALAVDDLFYEYSIVM